MKTAAHVELQECVRTETPNATAIREEKEMIQVQRYSISSKTVTSNWFPGSRSALRGLSNEYMKASIVCNIYTKVQ